MSDTIPSYVQVAPNSTGSKIRNVEATVLQTDGTTATVEMQVVAIADPDGNLWVPSDDLQNAIFEQLQRTNELLEMILEELS